MKELPKSYEPKHIEEKLYAFWENSGFFKADAASDKPPYTIVIPPPNVTGALHMGHALVDTIQDVLIRFYRMLGFEALWLPGTDHAGIATQGVVEKMLFAQTGKRRSDFGREEFLAHVWAWKEKSEGQILGQIKKLGCSCDWSRLRFTMDAGCNEAVRFTFKKMFDEGLIYRGNYLVNWDPVTQTALSDDEVEHEEQSSFLWHIRYPLTSGHGYLIVATTRPETMLGDSAVAVHPDDPRYTALIGQDIALPLTKRKIPILADPFVDPQFGSGAVKITPAHDFNDFEVGTRHKLPLHNILTPDAKINEHGGKFAGLSVEEARKAIVQELKAQNLIEKIEPHTLRIGLSYRSKAVLQPYLSKQWFINMGHFKQKLLAAVLEKKVELIPPHFESTYTHWIENLRDWCISRQLWWGHRIPVWYNKNNPEEMICFAGEGLPPEVQKNPNEWIQDGDVLDTWFSSALWPLSTLGFPHKTDDLQKFYPTSTLVTAHDILFFWVARMIMMGEYLTGKVPFKHVFLHGLIYGKSYWKEEEGQAVTYITGPEKQKYDLGEKIPPHVFSKWEKMSKSKGNVIDPIAMIDTYGTDAVRFALCYSTTHARQLDLDQRRFEEFKNFANKIWNGARFVLMNIQTLPVEELEQGLEMSSLALEDLWILSVLQRTIQEINQGFTEYAFDKASSRAYDFFWNDFCAVYVELAKPTLFGKIGTPQDLLNKQKILTIVLVNAIRCLHPIAPFITEEIFQEIKSLFPNITLKAADPYTEEAIVALQSPACIVAPFPKVQGIADLDVEKEFARMQELVRVIRNIRGEMQIPLGEKIDLYISGEFHEIAKIKDHLHILYALTPIAHLHLAEPPSHLGGSTGMFEGCKVFIPLPDSLKEKEVARLKKEQERLEKLISATEAKLSNVEFREKAPQAIVQQLEQNLTQAKQQLQSIVLKL
jgi:valyl-tRNA synthetase